MSASVMLDASSLIAADIAALIVDGTLTYVAFTYFVAHEALPVMGWIIRHLGLIETLLITRAVTIVVIVGLFLTDQAPWVYLAILCVMLVAIAITGSSMIRVLWLERR